MLPLFSVSCIVIAIAVGYFRRVNIGIISVALAFLIGAFLADPRIPAAEIVNGWPFGLFFILMGMMLLFGIARVNGTLALIAKHIVNATHGRTRLIPPAFFVMSTVLAALGAGNIAVCALVLPIALTIAEEYRISPLLMASMTIAGANAGGLSPIAPTGMIAVSLSRDAGVDIGMKVFYKQILGQLILATSMFFIFKGHRLQNCPHTPESIKVEAFNGKQIFTILVFILVIAGIVFGRWNIGLAALTGVAVLLIARAADDDKAIAAVPWSTLILVCGVGMLVKIADQVGGIKLMTHMFSTMMNAKSVTAIMAVMGGLLSIVSSASGVVLPTLIPTVPGLVEEVGGDPTRIISAIVIGSHVVTNSPLSTLGALAVASVSLGMDRDRFFKNMIFTGFGGLGFIALLIAIGII